MGGIQSDPHPSEGGPLGKHAQETKAYSFEIPSYSFHGSQVVSIASDLPIRSKSVDHSCLMICQVQLIWSNFNYCNHKHALNISLNPINCNTPLLTIQYSTVQCNAMQYNIIQYNAIQCNAMQYNVIKYNTMPCHVMHRDGMHCNAIQYNTIYYLLQGFSEPVYKNRCSFITIFS